MKTVNQIQNTPPMSHPSHLQLLNLISDAMPDINILNETEQHLVNSEFHHSHGIIMSSES